MDKDILYRLARNAVTDSFFPIRWDKDNAARLDRCIQKAMPLTDNARDLLLFEDAVVRLFEEDYNGTNKEEGGTP